MAQRNLQILVTAKNRAQKQLNNLQGKMESMQPTFQKMAVGGAAAGAGIAYIGKKALDAAGEAEMVEGRFSSVFEGTEQRTREWVNNMAKEYGRATSTMQATASNVGGQLQMVASNLPDEQISKMSKNLSEQSVAMSAYYKNLKSTEDASSAMSKALAGQTDRLTEMGYQVGKNSEQFENMRKKLGFAEDQMNSTKEAQVIYNLIMKQNQMVMDAYANTQDNYAEKVQRAKEQVKKMSEALGKTLIPMIGTFLKKITPVIKSLAEWIKNNKKLASGILLVSGGLAALSATIGAVGIAAVPLIKTVSILASKMFWLKAGPITALVLVMGVLAYAMYKIYKNWNEFAPYLVYIWETTKQKIVFAVKGLGQMVKIAFGKMTDWIKRDMNSWIEMINKFISFVPGAGKDPIEFRFDTNSAQESIDELIEMDQKHRRSLQQIESDYNDAIRGTQRQNSVTDELKKKLDQASGAMKKGAKDLKNLDKQMDSSSKSTDKYKKKIKELKGVMTDFSESTKKAMKETRESIAKLQNKLAQARTEKSKDTLSAEQNFAKEYVRQEKKVKDLKGRWQSASDQEEKEKLKKKYEKQKQILEKFNTTEKAMKKRLNNARERMRQSDLEKAHKAFQEKIHQAQQEYEEKAKQIKKELNKEFEKLATLKLIEKRKQQMQEKYRAQEEKKTVESINRQIKKYNKLARAISKARQGQTSSAVGISRGVAERANQKTGFGNLNVNVNGDVSGQELIEKVKKGLVDELDLNTNLIG